MKISKSFIKQIKHQQQINNNNNLGANVNVKQVIKPHDIQFKN